VARTTVLLNLAWLFKAWIEFLNRLQLLTEHRRAVYFNGNLLIWRLANFGRCLLHFISKTLFAFFNRIMLNLNAYFLHWIINFRLRRFMYILGRFWNLCLSLKLLDFIFIRYDLDLFLTLWLRLVRRYLNGLFGRKAYYIGRIDLPGSFTDHAGSVLVFVH
jgi:hypothetical protein